MVFKKSQISPQYINRKRIATTILDVVNPAHFILRESPSLNASSEANNFVEAEESMQKFYESVEPNFFQIPTKDTTVVVLFERKFYRARVISILTLSAGYQIKVYLLDYGKICSVQRGCTFEIQKDFLMHPFQAVNFKLLGIEPISYVMSSKDLTMSYGPVSDWDSSSENYINGLRERMCNSFIEVKTFDDQCLYGNLFMSFNDGSTQCINEELILRKYAQFNESSLEEIKRKGQESPKSLSPNQKSISTNSASPEKLLVLPSSSQTQSPKSPKTNSGFIDMKIPFIQPTADKTPEKIQETSEGLNLSSTGSNLKTNKKVENEKKESNPPPISKSSEADKNVQSTRIQKLQKLQRKKYQHNNCVQLTSPETSPAKMENTNSVTIQHLSSTESNFERTKDIPNNGVNFSSDVSNVNISPSISTNLNTSNGVSHLSPTSPQLEKTSPNNKTSTGNPNRLQKLKKLSNCLQTSKKPNIELNLNSISESIEVLENNPSESSSKVHSDFKIPKSSPESQKSSPQKDITLLETSPASCHKQPVDFQKVKALLKKKQTLHCSTPKAENSSTEKNTSQNQSSPSIHNSSISNTSSHSEQSFSVDQHNTSVVHSNTNTNDEDSSKSVIKGCESLYKQDKNSSAANSSQDLFKLNDSKDPDSFLEELGMPEEQMNTKMSGNLNESSDSDDLYVPSKKDDSNLSKTDVEDSYVESCTKPSSLNPIQSMDFSDKSLWEIQRVPALQLGNCTHGPILSVEGSTFNHHVLQVLKEIKFYGPSCIQSVVWPSMKRRRSLIAIAPPHSGKTVAYVLPLVSQFMDTPKPPKGTGPIAIILCSSWKKVQAVYNLFQIFLGDAKLKIITLFADGGSFKHKILSLVNGCDVLITIPYCLLQYFNKEAIGFARCFHFILDDGTNLFTHHKKELKGIFLHFINGMNEKRILPQLVLCAERWNSDFHLVLDKLMSKPLLFFTSFLESAIFAKIPIIDHVCEPANKKQALLDALRNSIKIVIFTTTIDDAIDVHHFLMHEDVKSYLVNEEMEHYIADEVTKDWKCARSTDTAHCLVITDQASIKMNISNADCLIHFDIPPDSRLQFGNRFSCIAEHFQSEETNKKCVCHVLVTTSDYVYAPYLAEIIVNSGGKPSEELKKMAKQQHKVEDTSPLLCHYMKSFGKCKQPRCKYRHVIDPVMDEPKVVPIEGDIQGLVTHVVDASHYYMRIQKFLDPSSNKVVSLTAKYARMGFQLKEIYSDVSEDMEVQTPVVGENYVLLEENKLFYRIKILGKVTPFSLTEFPKWKVLYLDEGWIKCHEKLKLYKISDKTNFCPPLATEIYLCNVLTPDSSLDWNPQTTSLVLSMIQGKEIHGKIVLCLGETLWLNPIAIRARLTGINEYVNVLKLDQKLKESGHAKDNKNHLKMLYEACAGKVHIPHLIQPKVPTENLIQESSSVQYAFLDLAICEDVYVSSVISPHQFYVQRAKFVECLDDLLDNINKQIEMRVLKRSSAYYKGMQCIAPFYEDDRYYRAVITDVYDVDVKLYFVDFGDTGTSSKTNVYVIPPQFLLLPFQAIECELAGIAAAHGGWTDSSSDTLYDLTRDEAGDMKILQLKAYSKSNSYDAGNHYLVDLWFNEKKLSEYLLQAGLVIPTEVPTETSVESLNYGDFETNVDATSELRDVSATNSDSDLHSDEKDAAALFCGVLAQMLSREDNKISKIAAATITEVTSEDEKNVDKLCEGKVLQKISAGAALKSKESESIKPLIIWWDTPEQLNILINVRNAKVYSLDVDDEGLNFNTVLCGTQYSTVEKFFAKIQSTDLKTFETREGINIVAKKCTPFKWPRFTEEKRKYLHIKYDLIHIDDSDTEENFDNTNMDNAGNDFIDEKDESSDDEVAEPWRQIAKFRDPYNPLE